MKIAHRFSISTAALLIGLGTMPALAQEAAPNTVVTDTSGATTVNATPNTDTGPSNVVNGNANAENSIEQGLKTGDLSPEEAARLQAHQARIDQIESHDLRDGTLSNGEENRIDNAETREDNRITALDNNGVTADPNSQDSRRMERDVQRNANQQNHIVQGVTNGRLTNTEVSGLEHGQARVGQTEARFGHDGTLSNREQSRLHSADNTQRDKIKSDVRNDVLAEDNSQNNGFNRHDDDNRFSRNDNDHDHFRRDNNDDRDNRNNIIKTSNRVTTQGTLNGSTAPATDTSGMANTNANVTDANTTMPNTQVSTTGNAQTSNTTSTTMPVSTNNTATVSDSSAATAHPAPTTPHVTHMGGHH